MQITPLPPKQQESFSIMSVNYYDPFSPPKTDSLIYYAMMTLTLGIPRFRKFPPLHVPGSGIRVFRTKLGAAEMEPLGGDDGEEDTGILSKTHSSTRCCCSASEGFYGGTVESNVPVVETNEAGNRGPYYGA
jgi:hypothetical protein